MVQQLNTLRKTWLALNRKVINLLRWALNILRKFLERLYVLKWKRRQKSEGEIRLQWKRGDNYIMTFISVRTQITEN